MTMIAFIGSVFSPYYAWANRKTPAPAENFCAMNVALYQPRGGAWAMTERGRQSLRRDAQTLQIGPSRLAWDGVRLTADIAERGAPIPRAMRGRLVLTPQIRQQEVFCLDAGGRHRWQPIAPKARIEVKFDSPQISWSGAAYFDSNDGDVPLAEDFSAWHWSRSGDRIFYDMDFCDGTTRCLALDMAADGTARRFLPPPRQQLPRSFWRVARVTRSAPEHRVELIKTLEDAPFYARSLIADGAGSSGIHESLSLSRVSASWVRALLPFRMPRIV